MLGWLKNKIVEASAKRQVGEQMGDAVKLIKRHGGCDRVVLAYATYWAEKKEPMARFRAGFMKPEEYPMPRMLISTAAIQSMMAARKDLNRNPNDKLALARLTNAEHTFLLSWLHLQESDITHISGDEIEEAIKRSVDILFDTQDLNKAYAVMPHRKVADAKLQQGQEALENWRKADPEKFPIVAPI